MNLYLQELNLTFIVHTWNMMALVSISSMFSTSMISGFSTRILTVIMEEEGGGEAMVVVADLATVAFFALGISVWWSVCKVTISADAFSVDVSGDAIPLVKKSASFIK